MCPHSVKNFSRVRQARALALLQSAEQAGLTPISVTDFHAFAYFGNVLSPVWDIPPQTRSVMKKQGGPYYPGLQHDIDRLVGLGLVGVEGLKHKKDFAGRWRLEGSFFIYDLKRAKALIQTLTKFTDEERLTRFYRELAFAFANIPTEDRGDSVEEDAVYGVNVGDEVIIDYAEWQQANYSENAAHYFDQVMPGGPITSATQKLHLYTYHLKRRLASGG